MDMKLKELRFKLKLDQKAFAEKVGMTKGAYSMVERGHSGLTIKNLAAIVTSCNANANWIVAGIGTMFLSHSEKTQLAEQSEMPSQDEEKLLHQLLESRDSEIKALKELLEIYKEKLSIQQQSKAC